MLVPAQDCSIIESDGELSDEPNLSEDRQHAMKRAEPKFMASNQQFGEADLPNTTNKFRPCAPPAGMAKSCLKPPRGQ